MIGRYMSSGSTLLSPAPNDVDLRAIVRVIRDDRPLFSLAGGTGGHVAKGDAARFLEDWDAEVARRNAAYAAEASGA